MLRWLYRRQIDAFDREYGYDSAYVREILDADLGAAVRFSKVMGLTQYRQGVPKAPWYAAGLAGVLAEDCGPCTQLAVTKAERDGVDPGILRAILEGETDSLPGDVKLAVEFAQAVLRRAPDCDSLRDRVVAAWGKKGLISLSFAITMARFFPTLKYAMGYGQACSRVKVGEALVRVNHDQLA